METVSTAFGKATLTLETGKLAKQAHTVTRRLIMQEVRSQALQ